jgi:integrase/recombinase XerC
MNTLDRFINYIKVEKRYSEHTVRAYSDDINQFVQYLESLPDTPDILNVSQTEVRQWIVSLMNEAITPRTLRRKVASLNTFYKFSLRHKLIDYNPAEGLVLPRLTKNLPEFIRESSIDSLFEPSHFEEGFPGIRDKMVLELFYATGMRLAELINLNLHSVDLEKGEIKILGKRNKERIVPITGSIINLLRHYLQAREDYILNSAVHDRLILTNTGEPAYPRMVQRLVKKHLMQSTTLERSNPHLLRHTFATHMLNNGADLNAVKELLGHANLAATEIYTHNTYEKLRSIYKQAHPRA